MKSKIIALITLATLFSGCGEETKEAVKHDANKMAEEVSKTVSPQLDKLSEQSKDIINSVKKTIDEKAPQVTKIVEDTVKQVKQTIHKATEPAKDPKLLFAPCAGCHGADASKHALGKSAIIKGWDSSKIQTALNGYKDGTYGGAMKGVMKGQVSKLSQADVEALAKYISNL
jgi:cytochrome c553